LSVPARVLEDRQHQGIQVLIDCATRCTEGFLGRGSHLQATLLELGRNCPQTERFHQGKGRLDLGIGDKVATGLGRQIVRADGGRSRDKGHPPIATGADPHGGLDGCLAHIGGDVQPGDEHPNPAAVADLLERRDQGIFLALLGIKQLDHLGKR